MERIVYGTDSWDRTYYVDLLQDGHRAYLVHGLKSKEDAIKVAMRNGDARGCEVVSEDF